MADKEDSHLDYERQLAHFQSVISRQALQLEKHRAFVGSAEGWRQATSASAISTGTEGIKALILLNGGTFVALPAFKSLSDGLDVSSLFMPLVSFFLGLLFALCAFLFSYLSIERSALGWMEVEEQMRLSLSKHDAKGDTSQIDIEYKKACGRQIWHNLLCDIFGRLSLAFAILSFVAFSVGGISGILAFYPSETILPNFNLEAAMSAWLSAGGLILDIIGAVLIFFFGVRPKFAADGSSEVVVNGGAEEVAKGRKYDLISKIGIVLLIIGFGMQLLGSKLVFDWFYSIAQ